MYPRQELTRLAAHKAALRRRIADHRLVCVAATARVARPLAWLDRAMDLWRRVRPLALVAGAVSRLFTARARLPRGKTLGWLLRWGPLLGGALRRARR